MKKYILLITLLLCPVLLFADTSIRNDGIGAVLNITPGSAPSSPTEGDVWVDSSTHKIMFRDNDSNVDLTAEGANSENEVEAMIFDADAESAAVDWTLTGTVDISGATVSLPAISSTDWVDSDDYVAASIDNEHLADDAVDSSEIATDAVVMDSVDADGNFTSLTGNWRTTGTLSGGIVTASKSANYTIGTDDAGEHYGGVIYVSSAATITAPAVGAGMSFSVITLGATAVSVDVNASDRMYLDGTALDDGDKATNTSTTGDTISCFYESVAGWYCISGSPDGDKWTDGGA